MMVMNPIQRQATVATGREKARKLNGPFLKWLGYNRPMRIGIPYEMYRPIVAIEVAAEKATADPNDGSARQNARKAASQIVRTGLLKRLSTW